MNLFDAIAAEHWAIREAWLETIRSIAEREPVESIDALEARLGKPLANAYDVTVRDGVAILPVAGPLFRYANVFTRISGATSFQLLARDFTAALENPDVRAIVLNVDSPGGTVNGTNEFAGMVAAARGRKPIVAYVGGQGASAAYWIASAADSIVIDATAELGSIGVVALLRTGKDKNATEIVSSQSPRKRPDVATDAGRAQVQEHIDTLASVFVETVAANRGVDVGTVLEKFGGGGLLIGAAAVESGLADSLGSLESVLASLAERASKPIIPGRLAAITVMENQRMTAQTPAAATDTTAAAPAPQPALTLATLEAGHPALVAELTARGAAAERTRILAIQAAAIPGHESLVAQLVADPTVSAGDAALRILAAEKAAGSQAIEARRTAEAALAGKVPAAASVSAIGDQGGDKPAKVDPDAPIEERAQADWDANAKLRSEFGGKYSAYLAYRRASDRGLVRIKQSAA